MCVILMWTPFVGVAGGCASEPALSSERRGRTGGVFHERVAFNSGLQVFSRPEPNATRSWKTLQPPRADTCRDRATIAPFLAWTQHNRTNVSTRDTPR
jgi:hypothetical protein